MNRDDAIAWAVATVVWIAVLAGLLLLWSREHRPGSRVFAWLGPRLAAGLALWAFAFGATRWVERKLGHLGESQARAVRSTQLHSGSRTP